MAELQQDNQLQFLISDLGTRVRDIEERTNTTRERILLLGSNLLETKEGIQEKVSQIEKQNSQLLSEIKKINSLTQMISSELNNFVRKDEIVLIERMLKDFQPLEFIRKKDFEEFLKSQNKLLDITPQQKETQTNKKQLNIN
jgi:hypothetical protein